MLPWGPFVLGDLIEPGLLDLLRPLPGWSRHLVALSLLGCFAGLLSRRSLPRRAPLLIGALAGLLLDLSFGTPLSLPFALGMGALLGGWPLPLRAALTEPVALALPVVALTALVGLGAGLSDRWVCPEGATESLRFLSNNGAVSDVAVIPGNLPFILLLRDEGSRLERLGPTGVVNESIELERPGGSLVSSGRMGGQVARLIRGGTRSGVEWWSPSTMERTAVLDFPAGCDPVDGSMAADSSALLVACADGSLLRLDPETKVIEAVGSGAGALAGYSADSLPFRLRSGALARFVIETSTSSSAAFLGPFSAGAGTGGALGTPVGLTLARGPIGQIEVRGEDPLWTVGLRAPPSTGAERRADEARNILDRARVPGWPATMVWSPHHAALWVTSRNSGEISLVDPQVTWHRKTVNVGPVPRRVVVDLDSGSLFGVNRCGLFELRIASIFPWESSGDVEVRALDPQPKTTP
jgi:hypothetical protein